MTVRMDTVVGEELRRALGDLPFSDGERLRVTLESGPDQVRVFEEIAAWVAERHPEGLPTLSDADLSRAAIYGDEER